MKKMAGINTGVTAVGTGLGVGATVTGFVKSAKDKKIAQIEKELEKLRQIQSQQPKIAVPNKAEVLAAADQFFAENQDETKAKEYESEIQKLTKQSKNLGNWRTGLLAGNTVTNIAGAIIASKNKGDDLQVLVTDCMAAVNSLNDAMIQAKFNGEDVSEAQNIKTACGAWNNVDLAQITKRGTGAMISSSVGAALGGIGTITSGVANSDKIRDDNTESGKQKEKNLNTAANVLSVGATAATATATVFNATQISAIKKAAEAAEQ